MSLSPGTHVITVFKVNIQELDGKQQVQMIVFHCSSSKRLENLYMFKKFSNLYCLLRREISPFTS